MQASHLEQQKEAFKARRERFALAAAKPKLKPKPPVYSIPNTPFGVPKIDPRTEIVYVAWAERQLRLWDSMPPEWVGAKSYSDIIALNVWQPTGQMIIAATARHYQINTREVYAVRRTNDIVIPRHVAMYICKAITTRSLPEIGRLFGGRDHTTVLNAVRKMEVRILRDPEMALAVAYIIAELDPEHRG